MNKIITRPLKAFLCHASGDKPPVRELYKRLVFEGVDAWLDKEKLLPGQDWRVEIPRAVEGADVVIIFLSKKSVSKEGYIQKEIKFALDIAEEKPEGTIFLIPARLEECIVPERLSRWQWVDLYEEDGFIKLLRSLKLRANVVGAVVEQTSYEESDKEFERKIEQLYTEGLAAFYTEDWDRACQRFQTILSEHPNHKHTTEKMAEAEKQRSLAKLYAQAMRGYKTENWQEAIQSLEELLQKSAEYKDAGQLLKNARKQNQLKELYAEAKTLHAAQKWQAVLKVFEQISAIEPAYPDSDRLLPSTQKEVAELKRLSDLNDLYSHAVREMDAGQWVEALKLLEQVHKAQIGFLETERLLKKIEDEITKFEEHNKRNDQVSTLYEQAHGLIRSKNWRKALDKMEEILKLEDQFPDKDGISEKAKTELAREEQEAQRLNELAAMYAEAARLLKDGKYQEALNKWQEVKTIDPKYPDRQWVQRTARKKLAESTKLLQIKPRFVLTKSLWIGIVGLLVIGAVAAGLIMSGKGRQSVLPTSTPAPSKTVFVNSPTTTVPNQTSTPLPAIPVTSSYSDPTMYDDFDIQDYDRKYNTQKWGLYTDPNYEGQNNGYAINQLNGQLGIGVINGKGNLSLGWDIKKIFQPVFVEAMLYLDPATTDNGTNFYFQLNGPGQTACGIFSIGGNLNRQEIKCWSDYYGKHLELNTGKNNIEAGWHTLRIEVSSNPFEVTFFVDGLAIGKFSPIESTPEHYDEIRNSNFYAGFGLHNFGSAKAPVGYVDYVRMGAIADDPKILVYDNFNDTKYDKSYNVNNWNSMIPNSSGKIYQQDGQLVLTQTGKEKGQGLTAKKAYFSSLERIVIQADLMVDIVNSNVEISIHANTTKRRIVCGLRGWYKFCWYELYSQPDKAIGIMDDSPAQIGNWYLFSIEINPLNHTVSIYINGKESGSLDLDADEMLSGLNLAIYNLAGDSSKGYMDNLRISTLDLP